MTTSLLAVRIFRETLRLSDKLLTRFLCSGWHDTETATEGGAAGEPSLEGSLDLARLNRCKIKHGGTAKTVDSRTEDIHLRSVSSFHGCFVAGGLGQTD